MNFIHNGLPNRVIFGPGVRNQLGAEIEQLGCSRTLILTTSGRKSEAGDLANQIKGLAAGVFNDAVMHTPVKVSEQAVELLKAVGADCIVALGGGSRDRAGKSDGASH